MKCRPMRPTLNLRRRHPSTFAVGAGHFGQMIMVNQAENLVIVQWSTWPQAEPAFSAQPLEASLMFSAIAKALH